METQQMECTLVDNVLYDTLAIRYIRAAVGSLAENVPSSTILFP